MTRWIALTLVLGSAAAHAATFPDDASYRPLRCGGAVMTDPIGDQPPSLDERDLVGDAAAPAGLRAADAQFLYLRIRLEGDPAPGGVVQPFAWGMAFDLDGDRSTYELLVTADGIAAPAGTVSVFTNNTTTLANSPADLADAPAAATFPFADAARTIAIASTTSDTVDYYLDLAIPWTTLAPLGLDRATPTYVWAGSSTVANALDGDLACHDGRTGGPPHLDVIVSDPTFGDPTREPTTGPGGAGDGEPRLEGGGGCNATGTAGLGIALALLALRRRRRA
jgi:uncharacterized protein (TIGR03382 family)